MVLTKKQKQLMQLVLDELFSSDEITPEYIGEFPHISYLPSIINNYYFYQWMDSTKNSIILSCNTPKLTLLFREKGLSINLNVSNALANSLIYSLLDIMQNVSYHTLTEFADNLPEDDNELNYFKHWISRCMLQYWEIKYLDKTYDKNKNHLIIYDKEKNQKWDEEINSKNTKLPFGSFIYNDEFLEKNIFCFCETNMGKFLSDLSKDNDYSFSIRDYKTVYNFWIILILRNKHTIMNFSDNLKNEIKNMPLKVNKFNELIISYFKHDISDGFDKYVSDYKVFQSIKEIDDFINDKRFFYFAKDIYWRYIHDILANNTVIYGKHIRGNSIIHDIIENLVYKFTPKRLSINNYFNLSDYPCLSFKIIDDDIIPVNLDNSFLNEYITLEEFNIHDYKDKLPDFDIHLDDDFNIRKVNYDFNKITNFDMLIIPLNPSNILLVIRDTFEKSLDEKLSLFFKKHGLSQSELEQISSLNEPAKLAYLYNIMTYCFSKEFIVLSDLKFVSEVQKFVNNESLLIDNLTKLINKNKSDYLNNKHKNLNIQHNNTVFIKTPYCVYSVK
jgi:hypothetical protein